MSLLHDIAQAARAPRYVAFGRLVLEVRRVNSLDLARVGYAHLEGSGAYRAWQDEQREQMELELSGATNPDIPEADRARIRGEIEARHPRTIYDWIQRSPDQLDATSALLERAEAYLCAAVTGVGLLSDEAIDHVDGDDPHLFPDSVDRDSLAGPGGLEVVELVKLDADEDVEAGRLWVESLLPSEADRVTLGVRLLALQEVRSSLPGTFRSAPRADSADRRNGETVPPPAIRDPTAGP